MAERKAYSTKLNEYEAETLQIAGELWPEHADNISELIRAIILDWRRTRDQTGGKSATILREIRAVRNLLEDRQNV